MKWLALTFGDDSCASTHFRVMQYMPMLRVVGIELECQPASLLDAMTTFEGYDGILLQKKLLSWSRRRRIARSGLPVIFDIDDATWHPLEKRHSFITSWRTNRRLVASLRLSTLALPANEYLGRHLRKHVGNVEVMPMTLPLSEWRSAPPSRGPVVIGWAGAPGNHFQLRTIDEALCEVKHAMPEVVIRIFSGKRPDMKAEIDFVPFQAEKQVEVLNSFSIGLLPLPDTAFNHGKSPIKALQYMAAGIPCVAAALSGTVEMLGEHGSALFASDTSAWTQHLLTLAGDAGLREKMGGAGRVRFESHFTAEAAARRLAVIFQQTASSRS
jgi:glycosyltransferase involved in cell wall biosynthesis|uniref:glycosyltransferase n=1 Tax=Prosthecobacter sp. TaxID=1965333 RepID=UPI003783C095